MSNPITTYNGRVILFNNGVVDVKQGDVSLVDSEKVAHIPVSNVAIDNETIIMNANHELEVPIDEDTIYIDGAGFMKAKQGGSGATYSAGEHISISSENVISAEWPTVPTKVSELQNDSHFITSEDIPEVPTKLSELDNDSHFITSEDVPELPEIDEVTIVTNSEGKLKAVNPITLRSVQGYSTSHIMNTGLSYTSSYDTLLNIDSQMQGA